MESTVEQRFWEKVNKNGPIPKHTPLIGRCWIWTACVCKGNGYKDGIGYGLFGVHGKLRRANRVSYEISFGEIPEGLCVLHKCDNPLCVNPSHLFLGTNKENTQDMIRKGRQVMGKLYGENSPVSKLTDENVVEIIMMRNKGMRYYQIAKVFGINPVTVGDIIRGTSWQHVWRMKYKKFIFVPR